MEDPTPNPEGKENPEKPSFWKTVPGILTGIAAVVTAAATLLAAADKAGFFTADKPTPENSENASDGETSTSGDNSPIIQNTEGDVSIQVGE